MKFLLALAGGLLLGAASAPAQTLDRTFQPVGVYGPAGIEQALQLSDGARVFAGSIIRGEGQPAYGLFRYTAAGQPDNAFNANARVSISQVQGGYFLQLAEAPGGKLMIMFGDRIIRLSADGTFDQGFGTLVIGSYVPITLRTMLVQPDGKVVVGGAFTQVGTRPLKRLARFLTDGTEDTAFTAALGTGFDAGQVTVLARQPDGKLLVGGSFNSVNGQAHRALVRLEASGAPDNTFAPAFKPTAEAGYLAVQPDGNILVGSDAMYSGGLLAGSSAEFVRLTSTGQPDASFAPAAGLRPSGNFWFGHTGLLGVQADGRIVMEGGTGPNAFVTRLMPNGAEDPTWTHPAHGGTAYSVRSVQLLPNGQVLVGGSLPQFNAATERLPNVTLLNADGSYNAAYKPHLLGFAQIKDAVVQPDGNILIAGRFTEINDQPAWNLARLLPTGALDTVFTNRSRLHGGAGGWSGAYRVARQSDGKVLVAGAFGQVNGTARPGLARLLPTGGLDTGYNPPVTGMTRSTDWVVLAVQPDDRLLLAGLITSGGLGSASNGFVRLLTSGAHDASFAPATTYWSEMPDPVLLPDGSMWAIDNTVVAKKLLPTGALDALFPTIPASSAVGTFYARHLVRYPDGRLLAGGYAIPAPGAGNSAVVRYSAAGVPDPTFASSFPANSAANSQTVLLPDGKVLSLMGETDAVLRLQANGQLDPSFDAAQLPAHDIEKLVLQPDGALLVVGTFDHNGYLSIARYTGLVTASKAEQKLAPLQVWPNPAKDQLHLRTAASVRSLALLDLAGRVLRTQHAAAGAEQVLPVHQLPAGVYLLRVEYAQGQLVTRRVVVE